MKQAMATAVLTVGCYFAASGMIAIGKDAFAALQRQSAFERSPERVQQRMADLDKSLAEPDLLALPTAAPRR
jgi:hypothetical protein